MTHLLLATAISLSAVAEYYAIMGLMAIFSGAAISIAIMGIVLGVAKIVVTSWLYHNWKETPFLMKSYFVMAISILMLLTSMGIFGYLSKAHSEQNVVSGSAIAEVAVLDEKINIQKENINAARKTLTQLDNQVNAALDRTTTSTGADRSATIRRSQTRERGAITAEIDSAQKEIAKLQEARAPKATELRQIEAEVGPIKYIAALIYDESTGQETLEKAVRWVIILIVFVFDPLAVLMFIAYNQTVRRNQKEEKPEEVKEIPQAEPEIQRFSHYEDDVSLEEYVHVSIYNETTGIGRQFTQ
jgi:hypothetical protein